MNNCNNNRGLTPLARKNYNEDFYVRLKLVANEMDMMFPAGDFTAIFTSTGGGRYTCGRENGVLTNCKVNADGTASCFIQGGHLEVGTLKAEVRIMQDDPNYPNGQRRDVLFPDGVIELITGASSFDDVQMEVAMNYAIVSAYELAVKKGYQGTQEEFYATFSELTKTMNATKETAKGLQTKLEDVTAKWQELNTSITNKLSNIRDGKSAYEFAKEQGYVGTVQQWLSSLKGDKGDTGWLALVNHGTSDTTFVLTPNAMHVWGEVGQLTLTLGEPMPNVVNEYAFEFQSPSGTPTSLSLPATLKWYNDYTPTIRAGKRYQASIVNNVIIMGEVSV
ncbi:hypothetical protein EJ73_00609 [Hoylesella shahii DSM 15611 = JCM 12083]|uniref:BppU N-terminal domain-containing protein n=2 Tax=Hoylesella shahii TaxID=228603 RepID=A0A318I392_9BACT|nr:hypothetical protein EJ73_00609 [Hoylesella shahii DSM 15611 = JCM 12083]